MKILFVCTGNICRSPLAEALFRKLAADQGVAERFDVDSAGTTAYHVGQEADSRMKAVAASRGVAIAHRSRQLTETDLNVFDLILAMDSSNMREIRYLAALPEQMEKVRLLREFDPEGGPGAEVPDPYYGGRKGFDRVYEMVERASNGLISQLLERVQSPPR